MAALCSYHAAVSDTSVWNIEFENPFPVMKIFEILGVETQPISLQEISRDFRPYQGCIFDVLGEPDDATRKEKLTEFFKVLGTEGDPGRSCGLLYTIMHLWKVVYILAMENAPTAECLKTVDFLLDAGIVDMLMRLLHYCLDKQFLLIEHNRYIAYRIIEIFFAATQSDQERNTIIIDKMLEDEQRALTIFLYLAQGKISWLEQIGASELLGNLSCFDRGVLWLIDNPALVGEMGTFLWRTFDLLYVNYKQFEDRKMPYQRALLYTALRIRDGVSTFKHTPTRIGNVNIYVTLCALCNVCAAHPNESTMDRIEPSLIAVVKHGFFWNLGSIATGVVLHQMTSTDPIVEKFLSFTSWASFNPESQKMILNQLRTLTHSRRDSPLCFVWDSYSQSRSVVALLLTYALWVDYENGTHFAINGLVSLLTEDDDVAVEVIKIAGDQLFDLAHSYHHVRLPETVEPLSVKRIIMETFLRLSGSSYYTEKGEKSQAKPKKFPDPQPQCICDVREFCERHIREIQMTTTTKNVNVRRADTFKTEGNEFYSKGNFEAAIECYSKALELCPLTCTERRVTYHSNRAECYLKISQPKLAIHDCNKALAMNPQNIRARWRRATAWQDLGMKYPAGLDLFTIWRKNQPAKDILGEKVFNNLQQMINDLMDNGTYLDCAITKAGDTTYYCNLDRTYGVNKFKEYNPATLPACQGRYFEDIFGMPPNPNPPGLR